MQSSRFLAAMLATGLPPLSAATGQDRQPDSARPPGESRIAPVEAFGGADSVVYRLQPSSRLDVKTGKAGLLGFAGHSHIIRAPAFEGRVVYYPKAPGSSHVEITVPTESLKVLTPPDTAEIRKVTASLRDEVLHVDQHREIKLVSRSVEFTPEGLHLVADLTLAGQTREVPLDLLVELSPDSVRALGQFSVKQTDFGIKPYRGGPAGTVKVADRVKFDIDARGVRESPGGPPNQQR